MYSEKQILAAIDSRIEVLKEFDSLPEVMVGMDSAAVKRHYLTLLTKNNKAASLFIRQALGAEFFLDAIRLWAEDGVRTAAQKNPYGFHVGL